MKLNPYQKIAITTVTATLFLILVGGLVRSTGAGMGCPDWPKCFGQWIPPTNEAELPSNYQKVFLEQRIEKNQKIVRYLNTLGFEELAHKIENDPKVKVPEEFNAIKTWTEYLNRLVGAIIGILVFATFLASFRYWKTDRSITIVSGIAVLLTGFQGWLGSVVVSTNLLPGTITIHMIFALIIVNVLLYGAFKATSEFVTIKMDSDLSRRIYQATIMLMVFTLVQLILGTQVREAIDAIKLITERANWIEESGTIFLIHRSFSWLIVIAGAYLVYLVRKFNVQGLIGKLVYLNGGLIIGQVAAGIILEFFEMPPAFQVVHLVGIALMVCAQFLVLLLIRMRTV